jgi:polyhydroxybutyrate depolymerase
MPSTLDFADFDGARFLQRRSSMRLGIQALFGATVLFSASCALFERHAGETTNAPPPVGTTERSVRTRDGLRRYLVHVPRTPPRRFLLARRYPLLILLHGSGEDGKLIEDMTKMDSVSERYNMIVAYPDGTRSILGKISADWNSGECCGYAARQNVDDMSFLRGIIDDLSRHGIVNPRRIYVAGFSSGAELAYRAGCELADRVSAIGVVSGSIALGHCHPARPVSLLAIQGTADDEVPFDDDIPDSLYMPDRSWANNVTPSVRFWSALDGCTFEKNSQVSTHVEKTEFTGCLDSDVAMYTITGGVHGWPDISSANGGDSSGARPMHELAASDTIVRFLLQHRR